jgi:hypothetical protein
MKDTKEDILHDIGDAMAFTGQLMGWEEFNRLPECLQKAARAIDDELDSLRESVKDLTEDLKWPEEG